MARRSSSELPIRRPRWNGFVCCATSWLTFCHDHTVSVLELKDELANAEAPVGFESFSSRMSLKRGTRRRKAPGRCFGCPNEPGALAPAAVFRVDVHLVHRVWVSRNGGGDGDPVHPERTSVERDVITDLEAQLRERIPVLSLPHRAAPMCSWVR